MSVYSISVFLHVTAALAMFAAIGLEWATIYNLRRTTTLAQVREWIRPLRAVRLLGGPSALVLLLTGLYMSMTRWGEQRWIGLGLLGLVLVAGLGAGLSGRRLGALVRAVPAGEGPIPTALRRLLSDPVLRFSAWLRTALGLGVVFLMTVKPGPGVALTAFTVSLALGLLIGLSRRGASAAVAEGARAPETAEAG